MLSGARDRGYQPGEGSKGGGGWGDVNVPPNLWLRPGRGGAPCSIEYVPMNMLEVAVNLLDGRVQQQLGSTCSRTAGSASSGWQVPVSGTRECARAQTTTSEPRPSNPAVPDNEDRLASSE